MFTIVTDPPAARTRLEVVEFEAEADARFDSMARLHPDAWITVYRHDSDGTTTTYRSREV